MDIEREIQSATSRELECYFAGASRDGTFNRGQKTFRIAQADVRWLYVLQRLLEHLGKRSWIYREGRRNVWVLETCYQPTDRQARTKRELAAFARGYFDAEGGVPASSGHRMYIQLVQKSHRDLVTLRRSLEDIGIACGKIHNPSVRVDPDYWRFYIASRSHTSFALMVGSWHPRKRPLLVGRVLPAKGPPLVLSYH